MPFDNNLTLINPVAMTTASDTPATTTTEDSTSKAKIVDLGASILSGSPEGTGVNGIACALICTVSATAGALVAYMQASDSSTFATGNITLGYWEDGSIAYTEAPFHFIIRVFTEMRYIRANLTVSGGTWTNIQVVVGTHPLERL